MYRLFRILLFPFGVVKKIFEFANDGARDIENKIRFRNSIIEKGCSFNKNVILQSNVHILNNCIINNSVINSYTYIGVNCLIQNANIGKFCSIANNVLIGLGNHPLNFFSTSPLFYKKINPLKIILVSNELYFDEYKPIHIGNDVWIGTNAIILDGVNIGNGAVIASNSVVTKNVEPYSIVGGVPAKLIKYRFTEDKISELMKERWWELSLCEIKKKFRL
jgi:acetyltransferase-like isoleucine patch superfamily enzyme